MVLVHLNNVVKATKLFSSVALAAGLLMFAFSICSFLFQLRHEHSGTFGTKVKTLVRGALLILYSEWAHKICNTVATAKMFYHRLWILGIAIFIGFFLTVIIPAIIERILEIKERNQEHDRIKE